MAHPSSSADAVWARIAATVRETRPNRPAGRHWSWLVLAFTVVAAVGLLLTENIASEWATSRELAHIGHAWAAGRTYQLWALADTTRISVANIGRRLDTVPFDVATSIWGLAITVETATGVVRTEHQPIVLGQVPRGQWTP